jgi:hypothetical protein
MNRFDEEVRALLAQTPPRPELDDLRVRARRHRVRQGAVFVAIALVTAVATVGIAGRFGHGSSSPQIAVSPSTSTTYPVTAVTVAECQVRFLDEQEAQLRQQEKQLDNQLSVELLHRSPNAGATDAAHQAVLRELSDLSSRISQLRSERARLDPAPPPDDDSCRQIMATATQRAKALWCQMSRFLDSQRRELVSLEQHLNVRLTEALAKHAANAGALDAEHQAVLREEIDVQQRILRLDEARESPSPCPVAETTTSIAASTS